jgi:hypothetical protein
MKDFLKWLNWKTKDNKWDFIEAFVDIVMLILITAVIVIIELNRH